MRKILLILLLLPTFLFAQTPINNFSVLGTIEGCCYYVSNDTMSWTNANALCSISGGDMVAINSTKTNLKN
jgi:hypothetical protein